MGNRKGVGFYQDGNFAKYRHPRFIAVHFIALHRYCGFYKLKVCGNPVLSDNGYHFLTVKLL